MSLNDFCCLVFTEKTLDLQAKILHGLVRSDIKPREIGDMIEEYEARAMKDISLHLKRKR